ncbi:MAG: pilus assembly protein PilN [Oleiphilus sp.]|nr:MAG: pilus assembly protein PilN [Oleiphilus sp.]
MPSINLRPWREELRAERQKQFLTTLIGVAIVAGGLVFLWQGQVDSQIEYQKSRNAYIKSSMEVLDKKTKEIQTLKKRKETLLSRMKVIQDLQGTRPVIVRVFDELVRTLPDGLHYDSLNKSADTVLIKGKAESNNRISGLMRNLEASEWFANPNLTDVSAVKGDDALNQFTMTVTQVKPAISKDKKGAK